MQKTWRKEEMKKMFEKKPVVTAGERLTVEIIGIGSKGDGIAKKEGFAIVCQGVNVQVGDKAQVVIEKVLAKMAFAKIEEVFQ